MIRIIFLIIFSILSTTIFASDSFILDSFSEATKLSKLTNKPILLIFGADYCSHCSKLKTDILQLNLSPNIDNYIICFLDIGKNPNLKQEYNIHVIPNSRIIKSGVETKPLIGYNKDNYISWLKSQ